MEIFRGDIFYVKKSDGYIGSEQEEGRPAIIVSNNACNEHSGNVTVVYLTTKEKKWLPTHVSVWCIQRSTALCECVNTISKERLGAYIRTCTEYEMASVDKALMIQLGMDLPQATDVPVVERTLEQAFDELGKEVIRLKAKLETYKEQNEMLFERLVG